MSTHDGSDPRLPRLVGEAYAARVDVDTAARHLWRLHRTARSQAARRRRQRLVSLAMSLVLVLGSVGAVSGSASALPGDTLYPVKEGIERVELLVAVSDDAAARIHLRHARARLAELERAGEDRPELVPELAEAFLSALERAESVARGSALAEVIALRSAGALLLDGIARSLAAEEAAALASARGEEGVASPTSSAEPSEDSSASSSAGDSDRGGASDGPATQDVGDESGPTPPSGTDEPDEGHEPAPESTTAEPDELDEPDEPEEPAEPAEETSTAQSSEPEEEAPETSTAAPEGDDGQDDEAGAVEPEPPPEPASDTSKRPDVDELQDMVNDHHGD